MKDLTFNSKGYEFNNERSQLIKRTEQQQIKKVGKENLKTEEVKKQTVRPTEMQQTVRPTEMQQTVRPTEQEQKHVNHTNGAVQLRRPVRIKKEMVERKVDETNLDAISFDTDESQSIKVIDTRKTKTETSVKEEPKTIEVYRIIESDIQKAKALGQPTHLVKSGLSLIKPTKITINKEEKLDTDIIVGQSVKKLRDSSDLFNIILTPKYKIAEFDTHSDEYVDIILSEDIGAIIFTDEIGRKGNTLKINKLILNSSIRYILYQGNDYKSVEIREVESNVFNQAFISKHKEVWYYNSTEDITNEIFDAIVINNAIIKDLKTWEIPERVKDILNYESLTLGNPIEQIIKVHNKEFLNKLLNMEDKSSMALDESAW